MKPKPEKRKKRLEAMAPVIVELEALEQKFGTQISRLAMRRHLRVAVKKEALILRIADLESQVQRLKCEL